MEQRIDPKVQPEYAAGTDPAYIPGLTAPRPGAEEKTAPAEEPEPEAAAEADVQDAAAEDADREDAPAADSEPAESEPAESEQGKKEGEAAAEDDGPVFEASDRRGSITADRDGVRFRLDEEEADFRWDEIGAVEVGTPRFGRRFTVTVHVSSRRWFTAEVDAAARSDLKGWAAELDAVLDAYFEES
ncbi:hypothetical protein [Streptomyces paludis]|uniref:Uncharacterized protein n=1 Tax=Streptomyces paludis TaxID=2282738 RepID=A0A345HIJ4_9ACTN|nr:hypothetical protein [Streptomyces paludis]AXG76518.1 hypothetical protein DVK44_01230 [Streptomyces paludis]